MDHLTPEKRSWNMGRIRSIDTRPEKKVRSLLHNLGYRFRLHSKKLPGKPDIFLKKHKTAIFVMGVFGIIIKFVLEEKSQNQIKIIGSEN